MQVQPPSELAVGAESTSRLDADVDFDVDLAEILGATSPVYVSGRWYQLLRSNPERPAALQHKIERAFHNTVLHCQWEARKARLERRRAVRAPLLSRVEVAHGPRLVATDVSASGLRCSGRPTTGLLDIEFKLPNLAFPVAARAEVTSFHNSPVVPLVGLRFVDIERPYVEQITRYVAARRRRLYLA